MIKKLEEFTNVEKFKLWQIKQRFENGEFSDSTPKRKKEGKCKQ